MFSGPRMNFRIIGTSKFKIDCCKEIQTFSNLLPHSLPQFEIIFIKQTHCVHPLLSSVNNYRTALWPGLAALWHVGSSEIEPMSSPLAGGFLSTVPPGKSLSLYFAFFLFSTPKIYGSFSLASQMENT